MKDNRLTVQFHSPCGQYQLDFEDDGKVAYAYLLHLHKIVGDVWLYNRCSTPIVPEWTQRSNLPFANCEGYMSEDGHVRDSVSANDIGVDWDYEKESPVAYLYVFDELYGVVAVGDKPGYARFAVKNGPLARVMVIDKDR